jgi:hypothetical protein
MTPTDQLNHYADKIAPVCGWPAGHKELQAALLGNGWLEQTIAHIQHPRCLEHMRKWLEERLGWGGFLDEMRRLQMLGHDYFAALAAAVLTLHARRKGDTP